MAPGLSMSMPATARISSAAITPAMASFPSNRIMALIMLMALCGHFRKPLSRRLVWSRSPSGRNIFRRIPLVSKQASLSQIRPLQFIPTGHCPDRGSTGAESAENGRTPWAHVHMVDRWTSITTARTSASRLERQSAKMGGALESGITLITRICCSGERTIRPILFTSGL